MALAKVLGTETEFGITIRNQADFNPVLASSTRHQLVRAAAGPASSGRSTRSRPGRDARGFGYEDALAARARDRSRQRRAHQRCPALRRPRPPRVLDARVRRPAAKPPSTTRPASWSWRRRSAAARSMLPEAERMFVHKNNSDGKGNSYGAHENYLVARSGPVRRHRSPLHRASSSPGRSSPGPARSAAENGRPPTSTSRSPSGPTSSRRRSGSRRP